MTLADTLILAFALFELIFLVILAVVGLRFRALAGEGSRKVRPFIQRGQAIAATGKRLAATAATRGESILAVTKALAHDVSAKVETTRRIVTEVVHPETATLASMAQTVERGQAWTARLSRLGAAARRAAGQNGGSRRT